MNTHFGPLAVTRYPAPGQNLCSFVEQIARDNHVSMRHLAKSIDINIPKRPRRFPNEDHFPPDHFAHTVSCSAEEVRDMTVAPFAHEHRPEKTPKDTDLAPGKPTFNTWFNLLSANGARFCPLCLDERDGAWKARWYFPLDIVCMRHHVLLEGSCPRCGGVPYYMDERENCVPATPTRCTHLITKSDNDQNADTYSEPCGQDLTGIRPTELPFDHPLVATQLLLDEITGFDHSPGPVIMCGTTVPPAIALEGLVALALRIANNRIDLTTAVTSEISRGKRIVRGIPYRSPSTTNSMDPSLSHSLSPARVGSLLAASADVLKARDFSTAAQVYERYFDLKRKFDDRIDNPPHAQTRQHADDQNSLVPARYSNKSQSRLADAIELAHRNQFLSMTQRITYRTVTGIPRKPGSLQWPHQVHGRTNLATAQLPQSLWAGTVLPVTAQDPDDDLNSRLASSLVLAHIGTDETWRNLAKRFILPPEAANLVSAFLTKLQVDGVFEMVIHQLDLQWEQLLLTPSPIDYDRRRWCFSDGPPVSKQLATKLEAAKVSVPDSKFPSLRMWEILTGGDARFHPRIPVGHSHNLHREYLQFTHRLGTEANKILKSECKRLLRARNIDEPLEWCPTLNGDPPPPHKKKARKVKSAPEEALTIPMAAEAPLSPVDALTRNGRIRGLLLDNLESALGSDKTRLETERIFSMRRGADATIGTATTWDIAAVISSLVTTAKHWKLSQCETARRTLELVSKLDANDHCWDSMLTNATNPADNYPPPPSAQLPERSKRRA